MLLLTQEHFAALAEAGAAVNPYNTHAQDLVVPALAPAVPSYYGYEGHSFYGESHGIMTIKSGCS